jgi:rhodanese-related sulfurtransferase
MKSMKVFFKATLTTLVVAALLILVGNGFVYGQDYRPGRVIKANSMSVGQQRDWTEAELMEFLKKPWTQEELNKMGRPPRYIITKDIPPLATGPNLTKAQAFANGLRVWKAEMFQFGIGISAKDFYKIWIEDKGYQNPKIRILDVRQESEFAQGRVPGAVRVDTGLDWWTLGAVAPDLTADYYLMCKGSVPANGGNRGAFVAKAMLDMGYPGKILNITDGFRGWEENGFPIFNDHGLFTMVPGTFQIPEKDSLARVGQVAPATSASTMELAKKLGIKDW